MALLAKKIAENICLSKFVSGYYKDGKRIDIKREWDRKRDIKRDINKQWQTDKKIERLKAYTETLESQR